MKFRSMHRERVHALTATRDAVFAFLTPVENVCGVRASSRLLLVLAGWAGFRSHPFPHHHRRRHMLAPPP